MSGFKGTPGPWFWDKEGLGSESHMVFGSVYPVGMTSEENKSLISAAPELLQALISARKELEMYEGELTGEVYNNPAINAAINKALGVSDE